MVVALAHKAPSLQDRRALQRGHAAGDDPQRLPSSVGIECGDRLGISMGQRPAPLEIGHIFHPIAKALRLRRSALIATLLCGCEAALPLALPAVKALVDDLRVGFAPRAPR